MNMWVFPWHLDKWTKGAFISPFLRVVKCLRHSAPSPPDNWTLQETFPKWQWCNNCGIKTNFKIIFKCSSLFVTHRFVVLIFPALAKVNVYLTPIIPVFESFPTYKTQATQMLLNKWTPYEDMNSWKRLLLHWSHLKPAVTGKFY